MQFFLDHKEQLFKYSSICFAILFSLFLCYWVSLRTVPISDDWSYIHNNFSIDLLIARFVVWSQRIAIEIPMFALLRAPYILNIVFCALLYPLFALTLAKLLKQPILKSFFVLLPFATFQSIAENEGAGLVTTHFNYLLPLIAAMWSVVILRSEKVGILKCVLLLVLVIFSTSNEMLAVALILILPFLYFYDRKNKNWYIAVIAISVFHLCMLFLSGASTVRVCTDGITQYPDFEKLSLIYKLYQGTVATVFYYTSQLNFYTLFFVFTICYCYFKQQTNALKISIITTVVTGVVLLIYGFINTSHSSQLFNYPLSYMVEITTNKASALMCLSVVAICVLLYMLLKLNCNYQIKVIVLSLLLATFAIRMTLALSPTVFFSRTRTFFISNLLILLASCYLLIRFELFSKLQVKAVILMLGLISINYQALTMTNQIRLPITYVSSYVYQFTKCCIKYKVPAKYAETATFINLFNGTSSIYSSITPFGAYTSLREQEILKSGKLPLLKNSFYNYDGGGDKQNTIVPLVQLELLYPEHIKYKGMEPYNYFNEEITFYPSDKVILTDDSSVNVQDNHEQGVTETIYPLEKMDIK